MDKKHALQMTKHAELLKALSHPVRLCVVCRLANGCCCNVMTMEKELGITQSALSQHLSKLKAAGIIHGRRNGNEICYELISDEARRIVEALNG